MRKLFLALMSILLMSTICYAACDITVDGYQYCDFDLTEYNGLVSAPALSNVGSGRIYFDTASGKLKCSEDGGAYTNCVGGGGGGGSGTVTDVSVVTANGVSGSVATSTTTPAITLTLGAITPSSVNGVVLSGSSTPTLAVTGTSAISGTNTGDNATNSQYSGLAASKQDTLISGTNIKTVNSTSLLGSGDITQTTISGNAGTATALAANGANCSAGQFPLGVDASGAAESCTTAVTTLDSLTDVSVPTPNTGDHLVWSGTAWVPSAATSVVGSANTFYLDSTIALADNLTLSTTPSTFAEVQNTKATTSANSPNFFERFVSSPLGRTSIPGGTWTFNIYGSTSSNTGTNEIKFRVNRRVIQTGMTGTFTGAGATRTFTVTGGTPFVPGDANASRLLASLIETPTQTAWISGFTSSSVVTVTLTDPGFVNVSNVALNAIYYYMFDDTTGDMTGSTPALYTVTLVKTEFSGFNMTDRIVIALFGSNSVAGSHDLILYYGGSFNFTNFVSPLTTLHNDLAGLNDGDYRHLTAAEYTGSGTGVFARVSSPSFTTPNIGSATGSISGNAGTATALAANGANCSAGQYPLGVDASGAVESCTAEATRTGGICFHFGNGTDVITTGEKKSARREVKKGGTITGWHILSLDDTSGTITIDVWKDTYANYPPTVTDTIIPAGTKPNVAGPATTGTSTTLTSWNPTTFSAQDVFSVNVDAVTLFKDIELCLDVTWN